MSHEQREPSRQGGERVKKAFTSKRVLCWCFV